MPSPCTESRWDFSNLRALFLNCTLKLSTDDSHTEKLMEIPMSIMQKHGVEVEYLRPVDYDIAPGVYPDMTKHGFEKDDWPKIFEKVKNADILVIGSPIWLGEMSSECVKTIERLYAHSGETNDKGQYIFYGKTGGCVITGNEDGYKHCSRNILYSLQHIGFSIPPQADTAWVGEAGPGPSYGDEGEIGFKNDFTNRLSTFMTWNLMHMARMLKESGGFPAHGNQQTLWEEGCRFDNPRG